MMKLDIYTLKGKKTGEEIDLPADIFEAPVNKDLMHQAYVRQMANARLGTHSTRGRSEVRGGGRKPFKQKGTGRARQGSIRAAQWVGGGKVHTPKPRDYTKDMPKKMRRAALRSALSVKAAENEIVVIDDLKISDQKTKTMVTAMDKLVGDNSALILLSEKSEQEEMVARSANNLPSVKTLLANYANIRDLLGYDKVVVSLKALDVLVSYLGKEERVK
ncbi:MAG: 50S ribosomal protein L4 [Chloroflexi bacterium]|nr:50S ribosomal protein L4 [Chloroflexota bacterium]MBT3669357.1 50S ribosomal protein L4 [Chloroflexota bacterium]MBT4306064.1 50S ribosomal protein L4 [Chloroflexota bacterium]MBT4532708.1 50S ribosomal protein L4 [Chloroflexota bacterium]MBT4684164.1 50S ribosomal protein L4 [Chloroflexota bacterium]